MLRRTICKTCVAMLSILLFTSCDNFLDEAPRGKAIAQSVDEYNGMFNTTGFMNISLESQYYQLFKSDELIFTPECYDAINYMTTYPTSVINALQYKTKIYRDDEDATAWETLYKNIYTYNVIVNGVLDATGSEDEKRHVWAEAKVSRAYMHFLLAQWFGMPYDESYADTELTVPIVKKADTNVSSYSRATMRELYDWVFSEMEEACPHLEDRTEHRMRVYKTTGYGLMGKVYFLTGQYDKALTALRIAYSELPKSASTTYLYDYNELQANYGYREITARELLMGQSELIPYLFKSSSVLWCKQCVNMFYYYFTYGNRAIFYLKPEFYDLFDDNDLRRNLICTADGSGNATPYAYPGYKAAKINLGLNLEEVYLMLAECEARVGSEETAREVLTDFRKYRMRTGCESIPDSVQTKNDLIRFCVDELNREFVATGYRWYTLRRLWNDPLFQDMKPVTHYDGESTYTLEDAALKTDIPETVLKWNESWREK